MTDEQILAEAERIKRRAIYAEQIDTCALNSPELLGWPEDDAKVRVSLDAVAVGIIRQYLLEKFDTENPAHGRNQHG